MRVATFNIAGGYAPDCAAINRLVTAQAATVVGVQEVDQFTPRAPYDMAALIAGQTHAVRFDAAMPLGAGAYGLATLSAAPIVAHTATHYQAHGLEPRLYQRTVVDVASRQVAVYNTHLAFETAVLRTAQVTQLLAALAADPIRTQVVTGDFNMDQDVAEWQPFDRTLRRVNGPTQWVETFVGHDANMRTYAIDNILYTPDLTCSKTQLVATLLSDHRMLWADLAFKA